MDAQQFFKQHPGGEKWERMTAITAMHQATFDYVVSKTGTETIVVNGVPIVSLWDIISNYYRDENQPLCRVIVDEDAVLRDWTAKITACTSKQS